MPSAVASRRRHTFEQMEPRRLLAADFAGAADVAGHLPSDVEMHLPGSISGSVYATPDADGVRQHAESGLGGVRVELLNAAGDVLAEAITDELGEYVFPALEPGVYSLRQEQPEGFLDALSLVGSGGGVRMTANEISEIIVGAGDALVGYDFAEMPATVNPGVEVEIRAPIFDLTPQVVVHWSRPVEAVSDPVNPSVLPATAGRPPVIMRIAEPVFGGSSLKQTDAKVVDEALLIDEEEQVVEAPATAAADEGGQLALDQRRRAARDRAFELEEQRAENDDEAREVTPTSEPVVAERPAPTNRIASKPAA